MRAKIIAVVPIALVTAPIQKIGDHLGNVGYDDEWRREHRPSHVLMNKVEALEAPVHICVGLNSLKCVAGEGGFGVGRRGEIR